MLKKEATLADIKDFHGWLTGKSGEYNPGDAHNCLVCQYMRDRGKTAVSFMGTDTLQYYHGPWREGSEMEMVMLPRSIAEIAYGKNNMDLEKLSIEFTYEAARKRAEAVIRKMKSA